MLDKLNKAGFDPHKNSIFTVHPEGKEPVEIELVELSEKKREHSESFSLVFRGPKEEEKIIEQGSHLIKHPKMGDLKFFLVPIVFEQTDGTYYQALFNRLLKKGDE